MVYYDINDFLKSIQPGNVFLFYHESIHPDKSHYNVILSNNIGKNRFIVFSIATSNVDDRIKWIERTGLNPDTLVIIEEGEVSFFSKRICFNCNDVIEFLADEIYGKYLEGTLKPIGNINNNIFKKIINGVLISDLVPEYLKDKIKNSN